MTTLTYTVSPALYREVGIEAQAGDQVEIYLDQAKVPAFPNFILGVIQNPVVLTCGGKQYSIEYDETDLAGTGVEFLEADDVDSVVVVSEARVLFGQCVNVVAQNLSEEQKVQALQNMGVGKTLLRFLPPGDELIIQFSFALTNTSTEVNGLYNYIGDLAGMQCFGRDGETVSVTDGVLAGNGMICYAPLPVPANSFPVWVFASVLEGTVGDWFCLAFDDSGQYFFGSPDQVTQWKLYNETDAIVPEVFEVTARSGQETFPIAGELQSGRFTPGLLGQLAVVYTENIFLGDPLGFHTYQCYQENPVRWKLINPVAVEIPN